MTPAGLLARPRPADLAVLTVAVLGVSSAAPIIAATAAPALAIAWWRTVLGAAALAPAVVLTRRREVRALSPRDARAVGMAGGWLALHFAAWVPAVTLTSVASATALVAMQPVGNALLARARGEHIPRRAWVGIAVAVSGVLLLTGVDLSVSTRALAGDALALVGAVAAACYVEYGAVARRSVSAVTYATLCYSVCAVLLVGVCLAGGVELAGYSTDAWVKLAALTVLAQLLGHTLFNVALRNVSPVVVGMAILFEVPGAAVLAALWLDQVPPFAAVPAAALLLAGVALVVTARATDAPPPAPPD